MMFQGFRNRATRSANTEGGDGAGSSNGARGFQQHQWFDDDGFKVAGHDLGNISQLESDVEPDLDIPDDHPLANFQCSGRSNDEDDKQPIDVEEQRLEAQRALAKRLSSYKLVGNGDKFHRGDRAMGLTKFVIGTSARELRKRKECASDDKENVGSIGLNEQQKPQPAKVEPVAYEPYNSPFRAYLSQIENDYGVTSVESVGPHASREIEHQNSTQTRDDASIADTYGFSVENIHPEAYEDDVSTLGDESIRRTRRNLPARPVGSLSGNLSCPSPPESKMKSGKKDYSTQKCLQPDRSKDVQTEAKRTGSTLLENFTPESDIQVISPKSGLDSDMMTNGEENTCNSKDYVLTGDCIENTSNTYDDTTGKGIDDITIYVGDDDQSSTFIKRNKWIIIYFMVGLSLFLLVVAGVALTFSFLYLKQGQHVVWSTSTSAANADAPSTSSPLLTTMPTQPQPSPAVSTHPPIAPPVLPSREPSPSSQDDSFVGDGNVPSEVGLPVEVLNPSEPVQETTPSAAPISTPAPSVTSTDALLGQNDTTVINNATEQDSDIVHLSEIKQDLLSIIAAYSPASIAAVGNLSSPQYLAFDWMVNDPGYWEHEVATILQRWVLAVLFFGTGGPEWRTENFPSTFADGKTPWMSYTDECTWETTNLGYDGNICDDEKRIFAVHLTKMGLKGTIPRELALLSNGLRILFISGNELVGLLPTNLGELTSLQKLQASRNQLQGTIPSELGRMTDLTVLGLGNNRLEGSIPSELGLLTGILAVGLESNFLQGSIPMELCNMNLVENLAMEHNLLTGTIPTECSRMSALADFSVQRNNLTGKMPDGLCPALDTAMVALKADCAEISCDCCTDCYDEPPSEIGTPPPFPIEVGNIDNEVPSISAPPPCESMIEIGKDCYVRDDGENILISYTICDVGLSDWLGVYQSNENISTTVALFATQVCRQDPSTCAKIGGNDMGSIIGPLVSSGNWTLQSNSTRFRSEEEFKVHLKRGEASVVSSHIFQITEICP